MKYYWYSAVSKWYENSDWQYENGVTIEHPLSYQDNILKEIYDFSLLNWKEISKEDYDLYDS